MRESNMNPLEEQPVLLIAEASLYPPSIYFLCYDFAILVKNTISYSVVYWVYVWVIYFTESLIFFYHYQDWAHHCDLVV